MSLKKIVCPLIKPLIIYPLINPFITLDRVFSRGVFTQLLCLTFFIFGIFGVSFAFFGNINIDFSAKTALISAVHEQAAHPEASPSSPYEKPYDWERGFFDTWDVFTGSIDMNQDLPNLHRKVATFFRLLGTILFGGILISTLSNMVDRRVERWSKGLVAYSFFGFPYLGRLFLKKHYAIIGDGEEIVELIKAILEGEVAKITDGNSGAYKGEAIIVLTSGDVETLRERVFENLKTPKDAWNIFFFYGDLEFEGCLKKSYPERAKIVFILGDCDKKFGRDVRNLSCMASIGEIIKKAHGREPKESDNRIPVFVQFDEIPTYGIIQKLDRFTKEGSWIDSRPFNLYENWARLLWGFYGRRQHTYSDGKTNAGEYFYRALDYRPITSEDSPDYVRLVVVGFGQMGQALVLEALRICHYANFRKTKNKTKITIIDWNPNAKHAFESQHPYLGNQIYDIDIEFITDSAESPVVRGKIEKWAQDEHCLLTIAVCLSNPDLSLATGLSLPEKVYEYYNTKYPEMKKDGNTVLIRQPVYGEIGRSVDEENKRYKHVKTFGAVGKEFDVDLLRDQIPMQINGLYDPVIGSMKKLTSLPEAEAIFKNKYEKIKRKWETLEEYLRWSNRFQADSYRVYLDYLGVTTRKQSKTDATQSTNREKSEAEIKKIFGDKLQISPEGIIVDMEHRRWIAERTIAGFKAWKTNRSFSLEKFDPETKNATEETPAKYITGKDKIYRLHTCIRPTEDLLNGDNKKICLNDCVPISNMPYLLAGDGYLFSKKTDNAE